MCKGTLNKFWCPCTKLTHNGLASTDDHGHRVVREVNFGAYEWCADYFSSDNFQLGQPIPNCPKGIKYGYMHYRSTTLCDECQQVGCVLHYEPRCTYGYPTPEERVEVAKRKSDRRGKRALREDIESSCKQVRRQPTPALRKVDIKEVLSEPPIPTRTPMPNKTTEDGTKATNSTADDLEDETRRVCEISLFGGRAGGRGRVGRAGSDTNADSRPRPPHGASIQNSDAADRQEKARQVREKYSRPLFGGRMRGRGRFGGARSEATTAFRPRPLHGANIKDADTNADAAGLSATKEKLRREHVAMNEKWAEFVKGRKAQGRPSSPASDISEVSTPSTVIGPSR
ncbi:hypothetical protein C8A03DRAFT_34897 [Achaetomium macrosporum]|uniref:Uncharacterized protein n=1 Tax=Achaetomium macrosporum TaxID=79813 RepID=A0AAN7C865_9PEZI|nr:hypothetical protein C8A03DRAFT_34897 [Achaetomium macrosporum]